MWSVELVKKTDTGQSSTPIAKAIDGQRYTPPAAHREDLGADDRLGEEDQPEQEEAGCERPVNELSSRRHARSGDRR